MNRKDIIPLALASGFERVEKEYQFMPDTYEVSASDLELFVEKLTRKPLTDEQIDAEFDRECWVTVVFADGTKGIALDKVTARDFTRAIERAHGIGND